MKANQAKSASLPNRSHELRTLLNATIGDSELLKEESQGTGNEQFVRDLEKILQVGIHLLTLIIDVLVSSKPGEGYMFVAHLPRRVKISESVAVQ